MSVNDLTPFMPQATFYLSAIIAIVMGLKVVFKYVQKRNLVILNQRIDKCFTESIKSFSTKLEDHDDRLKEVEINIENIFRFGKPSRQTRTRRK